MHDDTRGTPGERPTSAPDRTEARISAAPTLGQTPRGGGTQLPAGVPARIGPYRVLRELGEGGMGVVLECEQEAPLHRVVAVKVIRLGLATEESIARFESERQVLAQLNHPAVARLFDAGAAEDGRPYFVMEVVAGDPVTTFCDRRTLTVRERLELFLRVCEGVQHAHQHGVIHRDLKPSNILVTEVDGRPAPKIIDFGIAKATRPSPHDRPFQTVRGEFMGTPEYMSPEQAEPTRLDVDTRTDVYALGVILYEMLVGALPMGSEALRSGGPAGLSQRLRDSEPPRPSARLTSLGEQRRRVAAARRTDERSLARALRGDLDWIVMKAMEKDREQRYAAVSELAADLRRHLDHQPVLAGPPGAAYRMAKLVRRHRLAVSAGAVAAVGLVVAVVGTSVGLVRARAAEQRALGEARRAERVSDFLEGLFKVSDPFGAAGKGLTTRDLLDRGAARIATELKDEPLVQARLMATMGRVYQGIGDYPKAHTLLEGATAIRRAQLGPTDPEVATSLHDMASLLSDMGKANEARPYAEEALAIRERASEGDDLSVASALDMLAVVRRAAGDLDSARPLYERALTIRERRLGPEAPEVASSLNNFANLLKARGEYAAARPLYERAVVIKEKVYGPDHPDVAGALNNLANLMCQSSDCAAARPLFERTLAIREKTLPPDHPHIAMSLYNLGNLHYATGDFSGALPYYQRALGIRERSLGPDNPRLADNLSSLGVVLAELGDLAQARALLRRALDIQERALGPDHPIVSVVLRNLARVESEDGNHRLALEHAKRALAIVEKTTGGGTPDLADALATDAHVLLGAGDRPAARPLAERALAIGEKTLGSDHPGTGAARWTLARIALLDGDRARGQALADRALAMRARELGEHHPTVELQRACWAILCGERSAALRYLRLAVDSGLAGDRRVLSSELAALRGDPEFESILADMRRRTPEGEASPARHSPQAARPTAKVEP